VNFFRKSVQESAVSAGTPIHFFCILKLESGNSETKAVSEHRHGRSGAKRVRGQPRACARRLWVAGVLVSGWLVSWHLWSGLAARRTCGVKGAAKTRV